MQPFSCWTYGEGRKQASPISLRVSPGLSVQKAAYPRYSEIPLLVGVTYWKPHPQLWTILPPASPFLPFTCIFLCAVFYQGLDGSFALKTRGICCLWKLLHQWDHPHHTTLSFQENPVAISPDSQGICLATLSASLVMTVTFCPQERCSLSDCYHQGVQFISKLSNILSLKKSPSFLPAFFFLILHFVLEWLQVHCNIKRKVQRYSNVPPAFTHAQPPPLSTSG